MGQLEDDPRLNEYPPASPAVEPLVVQPHVQEKFCGDCGAKVEGHGWDQVHGVYYCRSCFRRHRTWTRFKRGAIHVLLISLAFLGMCALILLVLFILDSLYI